MDPLSLLGAVSAAGGIIGTIAKTVKNLSDLRTKYTEADMSIRQLIRQLTAVKAALIQIQDWTEINLEGSPRERELVSAFNISFEGCKEALDAMAEEVADLVRDSLAGQSRTMRARYVWNETTMKDHQTRLDSQVQALQLLLQAVQCRTASEQTALLRAPKSRQIVQRIADDTSTLRATSSRASQRRPISILSHTNSTIGSTEFEMDVGLINTRIYRQAMAHQRAKSADSRNGRDGDRSGDRSPVGPFGLGIDRSSNQDDDSGFVDGSEASDHLSPINVRTTRKWEKPRPYERSVASDPADVPRRPRLNITSASESNLPGLNIPIRTKGVEKKRSFLTSFMSRSSASLSPILSPDSLSSSPGRRRGRRHTDSDIHRSIDLSSADGRDAPALVQAAQNGSGIEIEELLDQRVDIEAKHERTNRTALAVASHCGNDDVVAILLQHGANPNAKDVFLMAPLHLAAVRGHYRVVEYLLQEQADVDAPGPERKTPLRLASDAGHVEIVEILLRRRAKVNARDAKNLTALHSAARFGDEDVVNLLLNHRADIEAKDGNFMAAIHHAAEGGHDRIVDTLLSKKADIEALGKESMSPLTAACSSGATDVVRLLLQKKASLKHKGDGGMTALHWSSYNGHSDVVDLLLEKRLPIDPRTNDGRTPLHLAVLADNFATAELLLRKGASVEAQCQNSMRPIHYAAMGTNSDIVQLLLGHGAMIEAESGLAKRAIHYATLQGTASIVQLLLRRGAQIEARDGIGDRPLCIASSEGNVEIVRLLLDAGAALRTRYSKGPSHEDSPLCIAAKNGHLPIVQELVARGASVRQRDESNWQALRYAAYYGHPDVVQYLLSRGASISGLDTPGSFGFNLTASRIGFAQNAGIDEFRKQSVLMLLNDAEVREQESQSSPSVGQQPYVPLPRQDFPAEKADDQDTTTEMLYGQRYQAYSPSSERQELPAFQKSPRARPPIPHHSPEPRDAEQSAPPDVSRDDTIAESSSSAEFGSYTGYLLSSARLQAPVSVSQASRFTLDSRSGSSPQWRSVPSPVPSKSENMSPSARFVSPMASESIPPENSASLSSANRFVSPMAQDVPPPKNQTSSPRFPGVLQSPTKPPPPVLSFTRSEPPQSPTEHPVPTSPSPPRREAPLPPNLPPVPDPEDAIVVCDECSRVGKTTADLQCQGCRSALYMYQYIMNGEPSAQAPAAQNPSSADRIEAQVFELA